MLKKLIIIMFLSLSSSLLAQTDPTEFGFELAGRYLSGTIQSYYGHKSFGIYQNHLYSVYGNTLAVFDIDDPEEFVQVAFIELPTGEYNGPLRHTLQFGEEVCTVYSPKDDGLHVTTLDISEPSLPESVSSWFYEGYGVREDDLFDGAYVYRRNQNSSGFRIDSLAQSGSIIHLSELPFPSSVYVFDHSGDQVVLLGNSKLYFVDISDRSNPDVRDSLSVDVDYWSAFQVCDDYLVISGYESSSRILDISEGGGFQTIGEFPDINQFYQSAIIGDTLYSMVVRGDTLAFDILTMSDGGPPELLSSTHVSDWIYWGEGPGYSGSVLDFEVQDSKAIVSGGFLTGGEFEPNAYRITDLEDGFKYVDLSDPTEPLVFSAQRGRANYMANSDQGLWLLGSPWCLLDVQDSSNPIARGRVDPIAIEPFTGIIPKFENNTMFVASVSEEDSLTLEAYDVTDPLAPILIGAITLDSLSYWEPLFVVQNSMLFYISHDESLYTIDFSDLAQPELTSVIHTGRFRYLEKSNSGGFLYGVIDDQFILTLIDISDPQTPVVTGTYSNGDHGYVVNENVGFSARRSDGHDGTLVIHRLDVSNLQNIIETGSFFSGTDMWYSESMILDGSFLYVWSMGSIEVFDVSIAGQETRVARYNSVVAWPAMFFGGYGIRDVIVEDGTVYLLNDLDGLHILTHSMETLSFAGNGVLPQVPLLQQNYPNPFNPTTTISFDLPKQVKVEMVIYDLQGRQVTTLVDVEKSAGTHEVEWNGLDQQGHPVSTGVYLCKLLVGEYTRTIKMVYLR